MGKYVGQIHTHDMPTHPGFNASDNIGKVWECSCGGMFFLSEATRGWLPVDPKVHKVHLDAPEV